MTKREAFDREYMNVPMKIEESGYLETKQCGCVYLVVSDYADRPQHILKRRCVKCEERVIEMEIKMRKAGLIP